MRKIVEQTHWLNFVFQMKFQVPNILKFTNISCEICKTKKHHDNIINHIYRCAFGQKRNRYHLPSIVLARCIILCDFFMFLKIKIPVRGRCFKSSRGHTRKTAEGEESHTSINLPKMCGRLSVTRYNCIGLYTA